MLLWNHMVLHYQKNPRSTYDTLTTYFPMDYFNIIVPHPSVFQIVSFQEVSTQKLCIYFLLPPFTLQHNFNLTLNMLGAL